MMELILQNSSFLLGFIASLIVWIVYKLWKVAISKDHIMAILTTILAIIQEVKTNPKTIDLSDYKKLDTASTIVENRLPAKDVGWLKKVFGSVKGAVEFVFHNKSTLVSAAKWLVKRF